MSFLSLPADNPFEPGVTTTLSVADPDYDLSDYLGPVLGTIYQGPWSVNPIFGPVFTTDADRNVIVIPSGGSTRPSGGLVYPRGEG